jgi:hypothetical protein
VTAAAPALETVIAAVKTRMDTISGLGTVLTGYHGLEDDVEFIEQGAYISSGSMNLWFIDVAAVEEFDGDAPGEVYERYLIEIRYWSIRTANADWSKEAREKAESVRTELSGNTAIFRIGDQVQLKTSETVDTASHGEYEIRGTEGPQKVYQTTLRLRVEARRWS